VYSKDYPKRGRLDLKRSIKTTTDKVDSKVGKKGKMGVDEGKESETGGWGERRRFISWG